MNDILKKQIKKASLDISKHRYPEKVFPNLHEELQEIYQLGFCTGADFVLYRTKIVEEALVEISKIFSGGENAGDYMSDIANSALEKYRGGE